MAKTDKKIITDSGFAGLGRCSFADHSTGSQPTKTFNPNYPRAVAKQALNNK